MNTNAIDLMNDFFRWCEEATRRLGGRLSYEGPPVVLKSDTDIVSLEAAVVNEAFRRYDDKLHGDNATCR